MSKSKGNVIDPLELIDTYGADALALHAGGHGRAGPRHKVERVAGRRLSQFRDQALERISRFAAMNDCVPVTDFDPVERDTVTVNRWIAGESERATAAAVTEALEAFRFNDAASSHLSLHLAHLL